MNDGMGQLSDRCCQVMLLLSARKREE